MTMTILSSDKVLSILSQYGRQNHVMPSPRKGCLRVFDTNNDVTCAIEKMGGINVVAQILGIAVVEINRWIDEHYVPEPFVSIVSERTEYSINALQRPTFYVFDGSAFWPRPPVPEEWEEPTGPRIYMPAHWT